MDAPEPMPAPYVRSTNLLASPAACASPSPCADSTNQACGYLNSFWLTNPNLHHGLLGFLVWTERVWTEGVCKDDEHAVLRQMFVVEDERRKGFAQQMVTHWVGQHADKLNPKFG